MQIDFSRYFNQNTPVALKMLISIILAANTILLSSSKVMADGETWCKVRDPDDTYVNLRYPPNGKIARSLNNGDEIWIDPNATRIDSKGRRWAAVFRNDKSGNHDYILGKFTYNCEFCGGRTCKAVEIN